jgi:hypothetical protein
MQATIIEYEPDINRESPEKALLLAVLFGAIQEASGVDSHFGVLKESNRNKQKSTRALEWFQSGAVYCSKEEGISFAYICESLSLSAYRIRRALKSGFDTKHLIRILRLNSIGSNKP